MNVRLSLYVLGGLLIFLGATLLAPIPFSLYYRDGKSLAFVCSAAITFLAGGLLVRRFRSRGEVTLREGFAIVAFTWLGFAVFGSLPYIFTGSLPHPVDALFEAMSGFTTTGASVMTEVEGNAPSLLFWRALTQWLGGMGIIVLGVAILPLLGVGGMQLYEAEAPGPTTERLRPRIQDTARLLWGVYVLITLAGVAFLTLGEMSLYDALCHTFTAIATGGFSTRNASMGAFGTYSQLVVIVLMVLGGANFSLHFYVLRGRLKDYWRSDEFRLYLGFLCGTMIILFLFNWQHYPNPLVNLRDSAFTASSVLTTTGFATADYEGWHVSAQGLLMVIAVIGGCAGSTAGGLKQIRLLVLVKHAFLQLALLIHPRQVRSLKIDHRAVSADISQSVLGFTVLFIGTMVVAWLLLAALGVDLLTGGSAVVACMTTLGPGLAEVGPLNNYAALPHTAKAVLFAVMLLGRLEISTVLVLFFVSFWRK